MQPNLETALRKAPRTSAWMLSNGYCVSDLPPATIRAWRWTDHGWRLVHFIHPQRVSARWAAILANLHPEPFQGA